MKFKSKKIGLLTQAVLASSVVISLVSPITVLGAQVNIAADETIGAGGGAPNPVDWVVFTANATLSTAANPNNTLGVSDGTGALPLILGLSAGTDGTANHGKIKFDVTGAIIPGGIGMDVANKQLDSLLFSGVTPLDATLDGPVFIVNDVKFGAAGQTLNLNANLKSSGPNKGIDFNNKDSTLNVKEGITIDGEIDSVAGGPAGTVNFLGNPGGNSVVTGKIGNTHSLAMLDIAALTVEAQDVVIKSPINFSDAGTLQIETDATVVTGAVTTTGGNGKGTLQFQEGGTVAGNIGANGASLAQITAHGDNTVGGAKELSLNGDVFANTIHVEGEIGNDSKITFHSVAGANVTGNLTTGIANKHIVDFTKTANMTGNIGKAAQKFALVQVTNDVGAPPELAVTGNIWAVETKIFQDKTLTLNANSSIHGNLTTGGAAGTGTLKFAGNASVSDGNIGTGANLLAVTTTAGTANIDADIDATTINIKGTSTLQVTGKHTFTGNLIAAGAGSTLSLGTNQLTVTGNATFGANDRLQIAITDAGNGKLAITGAVAAIDPTSTLALDTTGGTNTGYINGGTYTVITTTAGGVAVMPVQAGTSAILSAKTVVNGNNLDLVITRTGLDNAAFNPGPQGSGVATALETAGANTNLTQGLQDLMSDLQNLPSTAEVTTALQTLAPNVSGAAVAGSQQGVELGARAIGERMQLARSDVGSYHRGMSAGDVFDNGMGLWAQVVGSDFTQDLRGGVAGYDGNNLGVMFGADWKLTDELLFGVAAGYGTTDIDYDLAASTLNIDTWQASVYGSWQFKEPWFADGMIGVSHHSYDQRRNIILPPSLRVALANYNGWQWNAKVRAGYEHQEGDWHITPAVSLKYSNLSIDDYNETNAGAANLRVSNKSVDSLVAGLGVKAEYRAGMFAPEAHASAYYDFNANSQETNNLFLGSTVGFATNGVKPPHDSYEVGAGLNVYAMDKLQLNLHYDYSFKSDFHSHTGLFQIRYEW
ncbi:MAG: autotransporter domain-containing protein [Gammaproteobacteria bacterium]